MFLSNLKMLSILGVVAFFGTSPLFALQLKAYSLSADNAPFTALSITASDYCTFLNATAASDPYYLYDERQTRSSDSAPACILRSGKPGSYCYEVLEKAAMSSIIYVSCFNATCYFNWKKNADSALESASFISSYIFNDCHIIESCFCDQQLLSNRISFFPSSHEELEQVPLPPQKKVISTKECILGGLIASYFFFTQRPVVPERQEAPLREESEHSGNSSINSDHPSKSLTQDLRPAFRLPELRDYYNLTDRGDLLQKPIFILQSPIEAHGTTQFFTLSDSVSSISNQQTRDHFIQALKNSNDPTYTIPISELLDQKNQHPEAPFTIYDIKNLLLEADYNRITTDYDSEHSITDSSFDKDALTTELHEHNICYHKKKLELAVAARPPHLRIAFAKTFLGFARSIEIVCFIGIIPTKLYLLHTLYNFVSDQLQSPTTAAVLTGGTAFWSLGESYHHRNSLITAIVNRYQQIPTLFFEAYQQTLNFCRANTHQRNLEESLVSAKLAQTKHYRNIFDKITSSQNDPSNATLRYYSYPSELAFETRAHLLVEEPPLAYTENFSILITIGSIVHGSGVMPFALSKTEQREILHGYTRLSAVQLDDMLAKIRGIQNSIPQAEKNRISLNQIIVTYTEQQVAAAQTTYDALNPNYDYCADARCNTIKGLSHLSVLLGHLVIVPSIIGFAYSYIGDIGMVAVPIAYHVVCSRAIPLIRSATEALNRKFDFSIPVLANVEEPAENNDPNHLPSYLQIPAQGMHQAFSRAYTDLNASYKVRAAKQALDKAQKEHEIQKRYATAQAKIARYSTYLVIDTSFSEHEEDPNNTSTYSFKFPDSDDL